ncbi:ATP-binding protein [Streptomyces somaliensis DSM 40738]|uniref:ATP-binding protein n=1 Tax=Streptomyces somaliensis (strain ATCC 33201 / DSM 40738 / JCM 12659 / KCTC 9044 / NCTC 11332 / NRRL B-12077 / IP 733) TaxID=1134445 RepID=A0AA44DEK3_STRE0|nr:ATP-binding protein [Streptomyces somaliensis]MCQ0024670.1 ATP-binding protein [Streptomyces somaliensis DSM 40738]NKY14696.1 ATP-binding protein [Streptomyces somaliensis DSM 40738]
MWIGRFPSQAGGASTPWRGAKEVSGVALVMAQGVPASSSMAVPHGPAGVGEARRRVREQLRRGGVPEAVVDDAVLILSELLSNSCRYGRPLGAAEVGEGAVRAAWRIDAHGTLTLEVTDGGGPTRPVPSTPSVTARGGRGLNIISALAQDWGVRDGASGEVTVWVLVTGAPPRRDGTAARPGGRRDDLAAPSLPRVNGARHARAAGRAGSRPPAGAATSAVPPVGDPGFLDAYEDVD